MILGSQKPMKGTLLNRAHWACQGLEALYLFNEGSGNKVFDYSGNGHSGTATNCTWSATGLVFNGLTSIVDCGPDWIGTGADTFSAWIYPVAGGEDPLYRIIHNGKCDFRLKADSYRPEFASYIYSTYAYSAYASTPLSTWSHIAVTRNAVGIANVYVNGVLSGAANQDSGTPEAGTTNVILGNRATADRTFAGTIAMVAHWNHVLPADAIRSLSSAPYQMFYGHEV